MARILRQVTVARDGWHNAFTDLVYWQDSYWVGYRKGTNHASMDGEVVISVSMDRTRFREAARLKVPGDNRDPKLVIMGKDRLAAVFPTWVGGVAKRRIAQYVAFTPAAFVWDQPVRIL